MVTENQAKQGQIWSATKATESADKRWQLVVDELELKIAELEAKLKDELNESLQINKGDRS